MVGGEARNDVNNTIMHITKTDRRNWRLGINECPKVLHLCAKVFPGGIVKQQEQFKSRLIGLQWNPVFHFIAFAVLVHNDVFAADSGHVRAMECPDRDHHLYRDRRSARRHGLGRPRAR